MVAVVTASNVLVQFPVQADLGPVHLGDILTWGAFTYPFAFLVSDLTNRFDGPRRARAVVLAGFAVKWCGHADIMSTRGENCKGKEPATAGGISLTPPARSRPSLFDSSRETTQTRRLIRQRQSTPKWFSC